MKYQKGSIGRVIVAKIEHGDDLLAELKILLHQEKIESGIMFMLGALQAGSLVVGPQTCSVPPDPVWKSFQDGREILGIGTVFMAGDEPVLHLHASLGRGDEVWTGCIRKEAKVYLVVEVIILELLETASLRTLDELTGMNLLGFA
ncbi:MAG: PPC domain-containing DNA-binding protein [Syntrophomonadaceae bacterium]|nr:PPC domain-containing DNA-binding protein [Syntrophomonadaceae bacterium]